MIPALRGRVFRYNFGPVIGAELSGQRAALIISGDDVNQAHQYYVALPTSTSMPDVGRRQQHIYINAANTWAATQQIKSVHQANLGEFIGLASPDELTDVLNAINLRFRRLHNPGVVQTSQGERPIFPGTLWETHFPNIQGHAVPMTILVLDYNDGNKMAVTARVEFPQRGPESQVSITVSIQGTGDSGSAILNQIRSIDVSQHDLEPAGEVSEDNLLAAIDLLLTVIDEPPQMN